MPEQYLLIPEDRIGALIGKKGKTKQKIEKLTGAKIYIDSSSGEVRITSDEALALLKAVNICKAIARGFAPEKAFLLAKDYYELRIIDMKDFLSTKRAIEVKKARLIGTKGSVRKRLEELCNCYVSVYGNTVALIGIEEDLEDAERFIIEILEGADIEAAFRRLKERKTIKHGFEV